MKKKNIVLISVFGVLAVAALVVTLIFALSDKKVPLQPAVEATSFEKAEKYIEISSRSDEVQFPYIQTDFENVFYTASLEGNISFFSFENGVFTAMPETGNVKVSVSLGGQSIPAVLHYLNIDGKVCGYGIFTVQNTDATVYLYDYLFFKVINMYSGFSSSNYLLLGNVYKGDFFEPDKLYSEAWSVNLTSGATSAFFKATHRYTNMDGIMQPDFSCLTDELLSFSKGGNLLFLSSRYHNPTAEPGDRDILTRSSSGDENLKVSDVLDLYAHETDNGIVFLRKTETGFNSILLSDGQETVIKEFSGDFYTAYARCGDYLYSIQEGLLYNLIDGSSKGIGIVEGSVSFLALSDDGTKLVVGGEVNDHQFLGFSDLSSGKSRMFKGTGLFCSLENPNFCFSGNYVIHLMDCGKLSENLKYCVVSWQDLF